MALEALECGGGGDCLFHALREGLVRWYGLAIKTSQVRALLSWSLRDPRAAQTFARAANLPAGVDVRAYVARMGPTFQGTDLVLAWMVHHQLLGRGLGVVALTSRGLDHTQLYAREDTTHVIRLLNVRNSHWQLLVDRADGGAVEPVPTALTRVPLTAFWDW